MADATMAERIEPIAARIERSNAVDARDVADALRYIAQGQDDRFGALSSRVSWLLGICTALLVTASSALIAWATNGIGG